MNETGANICRTAPYVVKAPLNIWNVPKRHDATASMGHSDFVRLPAERDC